ncbi:MAG: toxin TcdB middle/N-terminal domain-containing protein, partial [Pseudomonadota bacterium]
MAQDDSSQPGSGTQAPGFGGISNAVSKADSSPYRSVLDGKADLFDVNSDGLADLVVTDPARFRTFEGKPAVGVFFNGFLGPGAAVATNAGTFSGPVPMGIPSGYSNVLSLTSPNIVPMDVDGDGRGDFLHMPRLAQYGFFAPVRNGDDSAVRPSEQGWKWKYLAKTLPTSDNDPRIDFTGEGGRIKVFDVNKDHLVDVVRTTGTGMQTWLNLGWLPGGNGRFGSYRFDQASNTWKLSTEPVTSCLLWAGNAVDFADPEVRLSDMNGDGLQDIVKIRAGRVVYWPGRGEGKWGDDSDSCESGNNDSYIEMATPPQELNVELAGVHLADVNGDGTTDVAQVRFREIDVWFNQGGRSFTGRIIATGAPPMASFESFVRFADIDGSGTLDVLFARADDWQWVDLMGGEQPRLLTRVENGLGGVTTIGYGSSIEDYLADLAQADECRARGMPSTRCDRFAWSRSCGADAVECQPGGSPVVSTVVREVVASDELGVFGRTTNRIVKRYRYHDGYYEGIEQEFRGFGAADEESVGDETHPTSLSRTYFYQGRRPPEIVWDRLADNPDEALKGHGYLVEHYDIGGTYLDTIHHTYRLRRLHQGLNGVTVNDALVVQTDELRYGGTGASLRSALQLPAVVRDGGIENRQVAIRPGGFAHIRSTIDEFDGVGNVLIATKHGRLQGEDGELPPTAAAGRVVLDVPMFPSEAIRAHATPQNISGSATGWMWRTIESYKTGDADDAPLGLTGLFYNNTGDAVLSVTEVSQPQMPEFGGPGSANLGSPSPEPIEESTAFDGWGNAISLCSGGDIRSGTGRCLRFRTMSYDSDYACYPVAEAVATSRTADGFSWLSTSGEWDRGLGAITVMRDPNGYESRVTYDGLGRLTSAWLPPVVGCESASMPSSVVRYHVSADPASQPASWVKTTKYLSCVDESQILESIVYLDGLGRVRATLATAEQESGSEWIKGGVSTFDAKGAVRSSYQPELYRGAAEDIGGAVALPQTAAQLVFYDPFSRPAVTIAEDGSSTVIHYRALSKDVWDAADLDPNSPHWGTPTTERIDGHSRVIDQVLRNRRQLVLPDSPQDNGSGGGEPGQPGSPPAAGPVEYYRLLTEYRADDVVVAVARGETADDRPFSMLLASTRRAF